MSYVTSTRRKQLYVTTTVPGLRTMNIHKSRFRSPLSNLNGVTVDRSVAVLQLRSVSVASPVGIFILKAYVIYIVPSK